MPSHLTAVGVKWGFLFILFGLLFQFNISNYTIIVAIVNVIVNIIVVVIVIVIVIVIFIVSVIVIVILNVIVITIRGFCLRQRSAFFDVRICDPNADS